MATVKWIKLRILLTSLGFVLFLILLLLRSYYLHIGGNIKVHQLASRQYKATVPVQPKRGTIFDRNGQVLGMDLQVATIGIHPQQLKDKEGLSVLLSTALQMPVAQIRAKLNFNKKFAWLARRVPVERGEEVLKLKLDGIQVTREYRRFYPNQELAGNILGAVGYDAKALGGIELAMDNYLRTSSEKLILEKDARGRTFTPVEEAEVHHDVHLTLDANIQFIAEKFLKETGETYKAKSGFAIVADPKTGEVLAMANYPAFNPNEYWKFSQDNWKNHAVIDTFEPGSTFKAMVAAAALESGKVGMNDSFYCEAGSYTIGSRVIHDHHPYGTLSLQDIIKVSSNIGVTKVSQKVGKQTYYHIVENLGFGKKTGIEFPGEESGVLMPLRLWSDIAFSNITFGQGISVSGMQMAMAYASFANGGVLMKPYLISKITGLDKSIVKENSPSVIRQVVKKETAKNLTQILKAVVTPEGTGKLAKLDRYDVAGKTGTAQKVNPQTKAYDHENYVSSFIGYVPAGEPQLVIYVVYDAPQPVHAGGVVAAPVFRNIARDVLAYRGIVPQDVKVAQVK